MSNALSETTTHPTVTFNPDDKTITLTVIVSPPAEGSNLGVTVSPCLVPGGDWTMYWDLVPEGVEAHFVSIDVPENPLPSGNVTVTPHPAELLTPTRASVRIQNNVESPNSFSYLINVAPDANPALVTRHDPTISVVSDPPNG